VNERIWQRLYEAALSESDPHELGLRIYETEAAIFLRLQAPGGVSPAELDEIKQAIAAIRRLQVEGLHFPELSSKY